MTLDTSDLRSTIAALEEQVARLRRIADEAEAESAQGVDLASLDLALPPEIVVTRPGEIVIYLRQHPDLIPIVGELAAALVEEFRGERSEIEFALYLDPEIDEQYLVLYVRLPEYDDGFIRRLKAVLRPFDDRRAKVDGWLVVTSDFEPTE
jgi:hypothetical protein